MKTLKKIIFTAILPVLLLSISPAVANAGTSLGPRGGYDTDTESLFIGGEAEFGRVLQAFRLAPSVDIELGDNSFTAVNADFRLYLFNLPETGLQFYGSAGPTLLLGVGGRGNSDTELGLSLVAGMKIPMKNKNRYNIEARFGFSDIPDFKISAAILFNI